MNENDIDKRARWTKEKDDQLVRLLTACIFVGCVFAAIFYLYAVDKLELKEFEMRKTGVDAGTFRACLRGSIGVPAKRP